MSDEAFARVDAQKIAALALMYEKLNVFNMAAKVAADAADASFHASRLAAGSLDNWVKGLGMFDTFTTAAALATSTALDSERAARSAVFALDTAIAASQVAMYAAAAMEQWARANGCEWDARTCAYAAKEGHLTVLQWAQANGCAE